VNKPIVSINCLTYNHAPYVRQCLDGFIMQKTDFPIEVLVHDDASTDGTADIVREYEQKYPDIIKPIYQTENQYSKGISPSRTYNYPRAQGKYIAICEGDDYWTDPCKLQKQVDFLEANPEYGLCYTKARVYSQKKNEFEKWSMGTEVYKKEDFPYSAVIPTLTICLRKELLFKYYEEIKPETRGWKFIGDYPIKLWFYCNSRVHFINEITCVYRVNVGSTMNPTSYERLVELCNEDYRMITFLAKYYGFYTPEMKKYIISTYLSQRAIGARDFKKYAEWIKIGQMIDENTYKKFFIKLIGRSILLMKIYRYYCIKKRILV